MPPPRLFGSIAYDPVNRCMLLFGGSAVTPFTPHPVDTWIWNGFVWRELTPAVHPPSMEAPGMVTDSNRGRIVFYGAQSAGSGVWTWDGLDWTNVAGAGHPLPRRSGFSMAFDAGRDRVVLTGGSGYVGAYTVQFNETWEFDGTSWSLLPTTASPPCMSGAGVVYDPSAELVLLVGGGDFSNPVAPCYNLDVWELRTPTPSSYIAGPGGCAGSAGLPTLIAAAGSRPWLGDTLDVDLAQVAPGTSSLMATGFSTSVWGRYRLPLDLALVGAPGCPLRVAPFVWYPFRMGPAGMPRWSLQIPNDPTLAGAQFHNQALTLDPGVNPLGATVSNVASGTIGIR